MEKSKRNYYKRYSINENCFDVIDNERKAYFLGLLYADGYNNQLKKIVVLGLQEEDKEIIDKFMSFIETDKLPKFIDKQRVTYKNMYRAEICNSHMCEKLAELGCFQNKSLRLKFPTEEQVPSHLLRHFIRGYMDGDGCITSQKRTKSISYRISFVSTENFCQKASEYIRGQLDINTTLVRPAYTLKKDTPTRVLSVNGNNQIEKFLDWLYKDSSVHLNRKYKKYITFKEMRGTK